MTYPRNPTDILKQLRNEKGLSVTQMAQRLSRHAGWPESRWDNLEKGSQGWKPEYILDLVKAGVLTNTDPRYIELQDWEDYQEKVKDQNYQTINERFVSRDDFLHWIKTGRVAVDPLVTPLDPPAEPSGKDEQETQKDQEEFPSAFPDKAPTEAPRPAPVTRPRGTTGNSDAVLKKVLLGIGIAACLAVVLAIVVRIGGRKQEASVSRVVEVVVTATPSHQEPATVAQGNQPVSQGNGQVIAPSSNPAPVPTSCHISFRGGVPNQVACQGEGQAVITKVRERSDLNWAGCISSISVPDGWRVVALYETWIPPNYTASDPERTGWVEFGPGTWRLDDGGYQVYHDVNLTNPKRTAEPQEISDHIQEIIIYPQGEGTVVLTENVPPDTGMELHISWQK